MIPVKSEPEPDEFDQLVRTPGKKFLKKLSNSKPMSQQCKHQDYWTRIRFSLYKAYNGICSYSAHWIPSGSSTPNVDHFVPKSIRPELAYEWSNYRLSCPLINTLKRDHQDVIDPFKVEQDWFFLDFPSLVLRPNPELPFQLQTQVWATIKRLQLNDNETFIQERDQWLKVYCCGNGNFSLLKEKAPFIAYELERQGLVENIKTIMAYGENDEF